MSLMSFPLPSLPEWAPSWHGSPPPAPHWTDSARRHGNNNMPITHQQPMFSPPSLTQQWTDMCLMYFILKHNICVTLVVCRTHIEVQEMTADTWWSFVSKGYKLQPPERKSGVWPSLQPWTPPLTLNSTPNPWALSLLRRYVSFCHPFTSSETDADDFTLQSGWDVILWTGNDITSTLKL